ncbi:MAG: DNA translocase FtsK [Bacteroides sp.]|nr:DNA translocase FtsK [Bacteroides sp.]
MPKYDNYRPEINYSDELPSSPLPESQEGNKKNPPKKSRKVKNITKKNRVESEKKVNTSKSTKNSQPSTPSVGFREFIAWFKSPSARILWGIFLGCFTIYLAISFISYFSTCIKDQSKIAGAAIGQAQGIVNPGGEGGARLAEFLINEGFGLGALVIIIWTGALSLRILVGRPRFQTINFTIKCLVALITVSLIIGLVTYSMHTPVNWGGYHGTYVNEFIIHFIGSIGAVLLSIFMIALFIVICLRDLVNWLIRMKRKRDARRRIIAEEKAARLAKEEAIRRMQEQEEIDDIRAGETVMLADTTNMDVAPEEALEFSKTDVGNYTYPEVPDDIDEQSAIYSESERQQFGSYPESAPSVNDSQDADLIARADEVLPYQPEEVVNACIGGQSPASEPVYSEKSNQENVGDLEKQANSDAEESYNHVGDVYSTEEDPNDYDESLDGEDLKTLDTAEESEEAADEEVEESNDPMVVNVNTISQSGHSRFKPDIEHFEEHKYKFPPFDLLREGAERVTIDADEQNENKRKIEKTLLDFGIPITRIEATVGPTVTLYEIVPDTGVKIAKIRSLVDDIALSLAAVGVRIIAPIPGKGTVGIEVANKDPQVVSMRTIIKSNKYQQSKYNLPIALGSTISNDVYIADLAKMPHLLVAGATGQGKSVGLNAIIASLLYCKAPHQVKFVMIDPKQVEFSLYNKLKNYYLAAIPGEEDEPVITDMPKVEATLNSLTIEMEQRYTLLKNAETRNIEEYNTKIREGKLNPAEGHRFLPYIVVVVDEFGDLKMVLGNNVELPIARLAQKARAVGMHVIIATQRPSTNVITGIIKANFPARISFKVTSGVDSKTILDTPGAQQLIGRGDMLIFNNSEMVRVQCAFIDTPEVASICEYVDRQPYPQGVYLLPEPTIEGGDGGDGAANDGPIGDRDKLFVEVARAVVNSGRASTSNVQRTYEIGYNRAGRIMDQLERFGVVGPSQGGKPRVVLMSPSELEDLIATLGG